MVRRSGNEQMELERKVRNWSAVVAGCGAVMAATTAQDSALSLAEKWIALLDPGVIVGLVAAVAPVYANAFMRAMQERQSRRDAIDAIEPVKIEDDDKP